MDTFRIFAGMVFASAVFLLVDAWVKDHHKVPASPASTSATRSETSPPVPSSTLETATAEAPRVTNGKLARGERIHVATDMMIAEIDTAGGDLRQLELTKYWD